MKSMSEAIRDVMKCYEVGLFETYLIYIYIFGIRDFPRNQITNHISRGVEKMTEFVRSGHNIREAAVMAAREVQK